MSRISPDTLRIVHVITRFIRGGADENTLLTCNGQVEAGHSVHLVIGDYHPGMTAALDPRVVVHRYGTLVRDPNPVADIRCLFRLAGLFRRVRPDIVHTHESKAGILGRIAARRCGVPLIVHGVHILPFVGVSALKATVYRAMERIAARCTDIYIDVSTGMRDLCLANGLGTPESHFVVASGMETDRFRNAVAADRNVLGGEHSIDSDCVIGLMSGTLEPRKRIDRVIAALAGGNSTRPWCLLIAGGGPQETRLRAQIDALQLTGKVLLLGHRSDLAEIIAAADVCLHAAKNEGLPRVVVQYALGGKPIVSTQLAGIERIVTDRHNGQLVPADDPEAVGKAFLALVDQPDRRAAYGAASRAIDLSQWDADTMVAGIQRAYDIAMVRKARHAR